MARYIESFVRRGCAANPRRFQPSSTYYASLFEEDLEKQPSLPVDARAVLRSGYLLDIGDNIP